MHVDLHFFLTLSSIGSSKTISEYKTAEIIIDLKIFLWDVFAAHEHLRLTKS